MLRPVVLSRSALVAAIATEVRDAQRISIANIAPAPFVHETNLLVIY
jgi:hypothetical protein